MDSWTSKKYFIGIDSDGTVFDSMEVKHKKAFIPTMLMVWGFKNEELVSRLAENINLYSQTRGIDRFRGLQILFQRIEEAGEEVPDFSDLRSYIEETDKLSNASLDRYLVKHDSTFLKKVLLWSREADKIFSCEAAKIEPFCGVNETLAHASKKAVIAVISSASQRGLMEDWGRCGLDKYPSSIFGQETGSKKEQLIIAGSSYGSRKLFIGDTLLDYTAAKDTGAFFYPIIPKQEEKSWELLRNKYLNEFFADTFDDVLQLELLQSFSKSLGDTSL